jgi:hypothetical protein
MAKIRAVIVEGNRETGYQRVQVLFGTNSFVEITENDGRVLCLLGTHDGGVHADASEADGRFAEFIHELMERHPDSVWKEE